MNARYFLSAEPVESMGRIEQVGKPDAIRARLASGFVKDFITG